MSQELSILFEKAVRFLTKFMPISEDSCRKPYLFHDLRVGVYLFENKYPKNIVIAWVLHDAIEWSNANEQMIIDEFGSEILELILANSKNGSIEKSTRLNDMITRCINYWESALIIKAADTIDSFKRYETQNNINELKWHCLKTAETIFELKPDSFNDKIFDELKSRQDKFNYLKK